MSRPFGHPRGGGSVFRGTGQYFECVATNVTAGEWRLGIGSGAAPGAGTPLDTSATQSVTFTGTTGSVVSIFLYDGFFWSAHDGVMDNAGLPWAPYGSFRTGTTWRVMISLWTTGVATLRPTSASWSYTPPAGFVGLDPATVWVDTGAGGVLVTGGGLVATGDSAGFRSTSVSTYLAESMTSASLARYVMGF